MRQHQRLEEIIEELKSSIKRDIRVNLCVDIGAKMLGLIVLAEDELKTNNVKHIKDLEARKP